LENEAINETPDCQEEEEEEYQAPQFNELVERFRRKVSAIPDECYEAIHFWLLAKGFQESRIITENKIRQVTKITSKVFWDGEIPDNIRATQAENPERLKEQKKNENECTRKAEKQFKTTRWYNEVAIPAAEGVGLGPMLAGSFLWTIGSAARFPTFGRIVRYAGLDVRPTGLAPKRAKRERITWNPELRTTLYKLTEQWNKMPKCVWRIRWDTQKAFYVESRPEILLEVTKAGKPCGKGHIHNMARRKIQRHFLRNLYTLWLEYESDMEG
jgi:hypothetical protein